MSALIALLRWSLALVVACAALMVVLPGRQGSGAWASIPPLSPKRIAITFDDTPRGQGAFLTKQQRTARLLAALRDNGVRQAAFFVNPERITPGDGDEEIVDAYVAAGHVIGDHTYTHRHLRDMSAADYLADIDKAEAWLKGRPGYRPWFRFPFLDEGGPDKAKVAAVRAGLAARGLGIAYVTADGTDWNLEGQAMLAKKAGKPIDMAALRTLYVETHVQSADFSDALLQRTLGRQPAQVLLLHETDLAALFVGDLVKALKADGWSIVTADQAYADPIHTARPDIPWTAGTLAEQLAWEKKLTGPRWYDRNDVKVADALFSERVLHEKAR